MRIGNSQVLSSYDDEATNKELYELLSEDLDVDEREFVLELMGCTDDEIEYKYKAYRELSAPGRFSDYDWIPFCKKINPWIPIIFDYFEFVCWKLKENNKNI